MHHTAISWSRGWRDDVLQGAPRAFQNGVPVPLSFAIYAKPTKPVQLHLEPHLKQESREMGFQIPIKTDLHVKSLHSFRIWSWAPFQGRFNMIQFFFHIEKKMEQVLD